MIEVPNSELNVDTDSTIRIGICVQVKQRLIALYSSVDVMNGTDKNVVLLELGVGEMTPSIIKLSFWEMTYKNEKVFYACLNQKKSSVPEHIKNKGIYIAGDLAETLRDLKENIVGKEM